MKCAEFPKLKALDTYDLKEQNTLGEKQFNVLKELNWAEDDFTLSLIGPTGTGKSHLSVALVIDAVQQGFQVSFVSMPYLMYILKTRDHIKKSNTRYKRIIGSDFIIIDDVMYMIYEAHEANLFFQFNYDLYDKAAFILKSNKGLNEGGKFLGDPTLTTAILDRLLHRSAIIKFGEEPGCIRMKYRKTLFPKQVVCLNW